MNTEKIFDDNARQTMAYWNIEEFKRSHPSLFKAIMKSMNDCMNGDTDRATFFRGDNELYKEHHREESVRLQQLLISKGFTSCGIGDAEGLWMNYSDDFAAGFLGMPDDDDDLYDCIKDQLCIIRRTPIG